MPLDRQRTKVFLILLLAFGITVALDWLGEVEEIHDEPARPMLILEFGSAPISAASQGTQSPGTVWY